MLENVIYYAKLLCSPPGLHRQMSAPIGLEIKFMAETVLESDIFVVLVDGKEHFFFPYDITAIGEHDLLTVKCYEAGHASERLTANKHFDIRDVINLDVNNVLDESIKKNVIQKTLLA